MNELITGCMVILNGWVISRTTARVNEVSDNDESMKARKE